MAAWPVTISYYAEHSQDDEQPLYQASFLMLENGISTDLTLDYGSYSLSGKLTKLELAEDRYLPVTARPTFPLNPGALPISAQKDVGGMK